MDNTQAQLRDRYKAKILAVRNYESDKGEFTVDDFVNRQTLIDIIVEINEGESDITPAGKQFLKEYYGFEAVAKMFVDARIDLYAPKDKMKQGKQAAFTWWLENMVPMEMAMFIAQGQGAKIDDNTELIKDLMPPE